jgi:DNA-binding NtrC family response regulator
VLALLKSYHWPGNVRELRNVINRAMIIARGPRVMMESVPDYLKKEVNVNELQPLDDVAIYGEESEEELRVGVAEAAAAGISGMRSGSDLRAENGDEPLDDSAGSVVQFDFMEGTDSRLETMERLYIKKLLDESDFDKPAVAKRLGVSLKTLYNKINKYDL